MNQVRNRAYLQPMLFCKFDEIWQTSHRAIGIQDLTDHRNGPATSQSRQIDCGFSVTGALQNSAWASAQRENVSGLHQVFGHSRWLGHDSDCLGTVGGADAGRYSASRIDTDLKVGFRCLTVLTHHAFDSKLLEALRSR